MAGNDAIQAVSSNDYGANKTGKTSFNVFDYFQIAQQKDQEKLQSTSIFTFANSMQSNSIMH